MTMKITYMNCHLSEITELDKNDHSRRKFQMALRGFCIWTLQMFSKVGHDSVYVSRNKLNTLVSFCCDLSQSSSCSNVAEKGKPALLNLTRWTHTYADAPDWITIRAEKTWFTHTCFISTPDLNGAVPPQTSSLPGWRIERKYI